MTNDEDRDLERKRNARQRTSTSGGSATGVILIIAFVVFVITNGDRSSASNRTLESKPTFSSTAILGGVERQSSSSAFRGAAATAFMGGVKLDFRNAVMEGDEARIDVSAIM